MVLPAVAAAGAFAQYANSEMARQDAANQRAKLDKLLEQIQLPNFDPKSLTPEDYQLAATYQPEVAQYIQEVNPQLVQETQSMQMGQKAQRDALERLSGISSNYGIDPQLAALSNDASRKAQIDAQSRQQSILQDYARRGGLNSGASLAAQLNAASSGMDRAAQTQNQLAADAYKQRLEALTQGAQLGGQMQQQGLQMGKTNADIINQFNQRNAANRQGYLNRATDTQNEAQRMNIGNIQDIMNKNVGQNNEYAKYNQNRGDTLQQARFNEQMQKYNAAAGNTANNVNDIRQNAADRNQAIQGVGNIFTTYQAGNAAEDAENRRQDREDRRLQYKQTGSWGDEED